MPASVVLVLAGSGAVKESVAEINVTHSFGFTTHSEKECAPSTPPALVQVR